MQIAYCVLRIAYCVLRIVYCVFRSEEGELHDNTRERIRKLVAQTGSRGVWGEPRLFELKFKALFAQSVVPNVSHPS